MDGLRLVIQGLMPVLPMLGLLARIARGPDPMNFLLTWLDRSVASEMESFMVSGLVQDEPASNGARLPLCVHGFDDHC